MHVLCVLVGIVVSEVSSYDLGYGVDSWRGQRFCLTTLGRGLVPGEGSRFVCIAYIVDVGCGIHFFFHLVCTGRPLLKVIRSEVEAERPIGNAEIDNARIVASTTSRQCVLGVRCMNIRLGSACYSGQ